MDVNEYSLRQVLEGKTRYLIPLYQRRYSWKVGNYQQLWDDVVDISERRRASPLLSHFTGSLVLSISSSNPGMSAFLVVDGQQRLTTLSTLLVALRDYWERAGEPERRAEIEEEYLTNRFAADDARIKLLPTQADRDVYLRLLQRRPADDPESLIDDAYYFFDRRLDGMSADDASRIQDAVLDGLSFVTITTHEADNDYRIFESLNNTGIPLTQADLIRNVVFMHLGDDGDEVYASRWLPLQAGLSSEDLERLFWFELIWSDPTARQSDTYDAQKKRILGMDRAALIAYVTRFERLARSMRLMRTPATERDDDVRRLLTHLVEWSTSVTDPLVLRILDLRESGATDSPQTAAALAVLESYLVRRFLLGANASGLNRILAQAAAELPDESPADSLHEYFSIGRKKYATDDEVRRSVRERPFYESGKAHQRRAVLRWMQDLHPSKERADLSTMTIEHVLPQTLTDQWRSDFAATLPEDADFDATYESVVHTLGNLTFTNYNPELSNRPFSEKRELLARSSVPANHDIAAEARWGLPEIESRANLLADRIIKHWPGPIPGLVEESGTDWSLLTQIVERIPPGHWTAYYQVGEVVGTHPIAVGQRLATHPIDGAWRVLKWSGQVGLDFRWPSGSEHEGDDPQALLESEGLAFDGRGRADPDRQLSADRLRALAGLEGVEDE